MQLEEFYRDKRHFFLTFRRPNSEELSKKEKTYFVVDPKRNPLKLLVNFWQSTGVFFSEKPDVVLTTGAGVAFPIALIAKIFGKKVIYIESFCRITEPSLSGKLFYHISDLFLVQWPEMKKYFRKAEYYGGVF
jgi:UDP-N-acetylglucosamine:LPS N-acetylglucosamine transferase